MQKKSSFTGLLITTLWAFVSCDLIKQYHLVNQQMTWTDARQYCRDHYIDLALISNQGELNETNQILNQYQSQYIWIGLYRDQNTNWWWSGGWDSTFTFWDYSEPNYYKDYYCVALLRKKMRDLYCNWQFNFLCFDLNVVLVQENRTWEEALMFCRDHYSDLISLMSDNEQLQVQKMMNSNGVQTDQVWTGLRYLANEWLWVNGDPLVKLSWTGGSLPSCPEQHLHCGTLAKEGMLGGISDCEERRNFLCST